MEVQEIIFNYVRNHNDDSNWMAESLMSLMKYVDVDTLVGWFMDVMQGEQGDLTDEEWEMLEEHKNLHC